MNPRNYWSKTTNPKTGAKFETFRIFLNDNQNGNADIDKLVMSEHGDAIAELAELRFTYEEDPMGEACLAYYKDLGVCKEMYDPEDFYGRWAVFSPLEMRQEAAKGKKYPLLIWNHGGKNMIEIEEFSSYLTQYAGREKYIVLMAQNTNYEYIAKLMDFMEEKYPVDKERIYVTGYSQGGSTALSLAMRMPSRLAGVAPNGQAIFEIRDNKRISYTAEEIVQFSETFVPFMQVVGAFEPRWFAPVNKYGRRTKEPVTDSLYLDPRMDHMKDPVLTNGVGNKEFLPGPNVDDPDRWKVNLLNARLITLGCKPRDVEQCLKYRFTPEDKLHHRTGFYGDKEETRVYYGLDHYTIDMFNNKGLNALRYVVADNSPHWPPVMLGQLVWEFFKQYRRDSSTGKIVADPYQP